MPDAGITKRALAHAFKELLESESFARINVADICAKCDMNRKSFYYHFKDKYDLVNWIFDTEFVAAAHQKEYENTWGEVEDVCAYFYAHHDFYRKMFSVSGQNSFSDHFRETLRPVLAGRLDKTSLSPRARAFQTDLLSDAFVLTIQRWLMEKEPMPVEEFLEQSKQSMRYLSELLNEMQAQNIL